MTEKEESLNVAEHLELVKLKKYIEDYFHTLNICRFSLQTVKRDMEKNKEEYKESLSSAIAASAASICEHIITHIKDKIDESIAQLVEKYK